MKNKVIGYSYAGTIMNSIEIYWNLKYPWLRVQNENTKKLLLDGTAFA